MKTLSRFAATRCISWAAYVASMALREAGISEAEIEKLKVDKTLIVPE